MSSNSEPLLSLCLSVDYPGKPGVLRNAAFDIRAGEILGLVGQSGSGKSTIALSIMRLLNHKGGRATGQIRFRGNDLLQINGREVRRLRGSEITLVQQSPIAALNPAMRIGAQLTEAWRAHSDLRGEACLQAISNAFRSVSLPSDKDFLKRYPKQLSVGQAQRVLIAMSILHRPSLLIADEPTSALDIITQSEVLQNFRELNSQQGMAILYISHDLVSVANLCDRIALLHEGEIVECNSTEAIFSRPQHPYTQQLVAALPSVPCN